MRERQFGPAAGGRSISFGIKKGRWRIATAAFGKPGSARRTDHSCGLRFVAGSRRIMRLRAGRWRT